MGRPTKLDDLTAQRIFDGARLGLPQYLVARGAGVSPVALRTWKRRGAAGEEPYASFLARLKSAEAEGAAEAMRAVREAARGGSWQAAAWILERRYPRSFSLRAERLAEPDLDSVTARFRAMSNEERLVEMRKYVDEMNASIAEYEREAEKGDAA
jgi:hypothetical protein